MPLIPESLIDEVQRRVDIAELIGRSVPLKRAGRHFKACCPFHKEKTPSFHVNTDKQFFHCFGCGVGGNSFGFLMQHDRLTFPEAVRQLADQAGVPIPDRPPEEQKGQHQALAGLMEQACQYFEQWLHAPSGQAARAYLRTRGVSEPTRKLFRIGWAPEGWHHLVKAAHAKGIALTQLEAAGLLVRGTSGFYDRFRNRLLFPILDVRGRVIGFGGRSLDGQEPKYLNSPETALYQKGHHLFGLAHAKQAISAEKTAIIVEGYFDCIVLVEAGVLPVVSPLGTALTAEQVRVLRRYAERVVLAFDADAAGEEATLRGIDLLVEAGLQVQVAQLPDGVDPDEVIRAEGREKFLQRIARAASIIDVLLARALKRFPVRSAEDTVRAAQFVLPTIARVPDAMLRSEYVRLIAERLHLDEQAVAYELSKVAARLAGGPHAKARDPDRDMSAAITRHAASPLAAHGPERLLVALVVDEPARWTRLHGRVQLETIGDPTLRRILGVVRDGVASEASMTAAQVVSRLTAEGQGAVVAALIELAHTVSSAEQALDECVRRLQANARKQELAELREHMVMAQRQQDEPAMQRLLADYQHRLTKGAAMRTEAASRTEVEAAASAGGSPHG